MASHKFDTAMTRESLYKRGFVWYGDEAVAFMYGDGTYSLLLPRDVLCYYPYYSASYCGLSKIRALTEDVSLLLLKHWRHKMFGGEMSDEEVAKAKEKERYLFSPTFSVVGNERASMFSDDTLSYLKTSAVGIPLVSRQTEVRAVRQYISDDSKFEKRCRKTVAYDFYLHDIGTRVRISWYLEATKQKKFFIVRFVDVPPNITSNKNRFDGRMPRTKGTKSRDVRTPTFVQRPLEKEVAGMLVQYGDLDKVERQWFIKEQYWAFPCQCGNRPLVCGEDDVRLFRKEEGVGDIFEMLDARAYAVDTTMDPESVVNTIAVQDALNATDSDDFVHRYPQPITEILLNDRDAKEVIDQLEKEFPIRYYGDYFRESGPTFEELARAVQRAERGAVEFWYSDKALLSGHWRDSAPKTYLKGKYEWK